MVLVCYLVLEFDIFSRLFVLFFFKLSIFSITRSEQVDAVDIMIDR